MRPDRKCCERPGRGSGEEAWRYAAELEEDACPVVEESVRGDVPTLRASVPPELRRHWGAAAASLLTLLNQLG